MLNQCNNKQFLKSQHTESDSHQDWNLGRTNELLDGESVQNIEAGVEFERLVAALTHEAHLHDGAGWLGALHVAKTVHTECFITIIQIYSRDCTVIDALLQNALLQSYRFTPSIALL